MKNSTPSLETVRSLRRFFTLFLASSALTGCQKLADIFGGPDDTRFHANPINSLSCDPALSSSYGGGQGTPESPYTLCTVDHWKYLSAQSSDWNLNFKLAADLDFSAFTVATYVPVGTALVPFTGVFDGGGKKISNLSLTGTTEVLALFRATDNAAEIKNLTLENFALVSEGRMSTLVVDHGAGGTLKISNITVSDSSITDIATGPISGVGLLLGSSLGNLEITDSHFSDITLVYSGNSSDSGGIVGNSTGSIRAERITVTNLSMAKSAPSGFDYLGGFAGTIRASGSLFRDVTYTGLNMNTSWGGAGLVSRALGSIDVERVHIAGSITSNGAQSGLIQEIYVPSGIPSITVVDSSFIGTLGAAGNSSYGGLLGLASANITIQRSFHEGPLTVWTGGVGGLIGQAGDTGTVVLIEDSYSRGVTTTTHATQGRASGLVATTGGGTITIRRSYAARSDAGTAIPGKSCIVDNVLGTVTLEDVYYDSTLCAGSIDFNTALTGASGVATASFETLTPFTNWLPAVWNFSTTAYPSLEPQSAVISSATASGHRRSHLSSLQPVAL